jgi:urea transport system ATP-binding protein
MLTVEALEVAYGRAQVLFGVDVHVPHGALVCVMGRNGVGKTTLLEAVMGLLPARSGRVTFDGRDITGLKTHERVRLGLGYVPQGHEAFPQLTVGENLQVVSEAAPRQDRGAVAEVLDLFPALRGLLRRRAGFLSGGQQQQLAIARALASDPKVLLLDEPTEGIQPSIIKDIARLLRDIRSIRNLCIVVCEQVLSFVLDIADRIFVMEGGRIVHTDSREHVDEAAIARFLAV